MAVTQGEVDVGAPGFLARFDYDAAVVERIKTIQRRHWLQDERLWVIEPHWPSVRRLLHIASDLGWHITPAARAAEARVREESEELPYALDVIHNGHGEAVFQCKVGDDDELLAKVRALPGAYWEGDWCVPTDWEQCCGPLRELVESDTRLEVSNAAWTLLTEPDVTHLYLRSSAPPSAAVCVVSPAPRAQLSQAWRLEEQTDQERHRWALSRATSTEGFAVSRALRGKLLPFQLAGVRYILEAKRVLLADAPGLGKTVQALCALESAAAYPALILCSNEQLESWQREAARWLPASRKVALWPADRARADADVLLVSYSALLHQQAELAARRFAGIIADDSHTLKHHAASRTQAALAIAARVRGLRLCLSGAPLPEQPIELAAQLAFLGVLTPCFGGFWPFAERYCAPQQTDLGTVFGADHLDELELRLRASCYVRREQASLLTQLPAQRRTAVTEEQPTPDRRRKPRISTRTAGLAAQPDESKKQVS